MKSDLIRNVIKRNEARRHLVKKSYMLGTDELVRGIWPNHVKLYEDEFVSGKVRKLGFRKRNGFKKFK